MKRTFGALSRLLRIADGVRLRCEHFGGIAFERRTGTTLDVDRSVFSALEKLQNRGILREDALARELCGGKINEHQLAKAHELVSQLLELAILAPASNAEVERLTGEVTPDPEIHQRNR